MLDLYTVLPADRFNNINEPQIFQIYIKFMCCSLLMVQIWIVSLLALPTTPLLPPTTHTAHPHHTPRLSDDFPPSRSHAHPITEPAMGLHYIFKINLQQHKQWYSFYVDLLLYSTGKTSHKYDKLLNLLNNLHFQKPANQYCNGIDVKFCLVCTLDLYRQLVDRNCPLYLPHNHEWLG